jgi:hypothetical protein
MSLVNDPCSDLALKVAMVSLEVPRRNQDAREVPVKAGAHGQLLAVAPDNRVTRAVYQWTVLTRSVAVRLPAL